MTIIYDFDYTLFDTTAFREAVNQVLIDHGASFGEVEEAYASVVTKVSTGYSYDPYTHAELLSVKLDVPVAKVVREMYDVVSKSPKFLYPGTVAHLLSMKSQGRDLVLLTSGNPIWQRAKVESAGMIGLFDEIVYTEEEKHEEMMQFHDRSLPVIVVNDNGPETEKMKAAEPRFVYIVKKSGKPLPSDPDIRVVTTFGEIEDAIQSSIGVPPSMMPPETT